MRKTEKERVLYFPKIIESVQLLASHINCRNLVIICVQKQAFGRCVVSVTSVIELGYLWGHCIVHFVKVCRSCSFVGQCSGSNLYVIIVSFIDLGAIKRFKQREGYRVIAGWVGWVVPGLEPRGPTC